MDSCAGGDTNGLMPKDVVSCILLWLPVISLLHFKLVSKTWRSIIECPDFVERHLHLYHHRYPTSFKEGNGKFIILNRPSEIHEQHPSYACLLSAEKSEMLDLPTIEEPFQFQSVELVASCNGIICLRQDRTVCLWNPATKQSTCLPILPIPPVCLGVCHIGFGLDVKTKDYKVVCLSANVNYNSYIYGLSTDTWRIINNVGMPDADIHADLKSPYHNDIYCWLGYIDSTEECEGTAAIFTFDFSNEVLDTLSLPDSVISTFSLRIAILRDNIACIKNACFDLVEPPQRWHIEVWILCEYGVKESWAKLYTFEPLSVAWPWLMGFSKNGDFLLFLENGVLCLYDLITQERMILPSQVSCNKEAVVYEESLVSIKRGNWAANTVTCLDQNGKSLKNQLTSSRNSRWCDINMPTDVVFHILLCLPVVSLLKFKSVCQSWCSLIKSSEFVNQHLNHHQEDNGSINLIFLSPSVYHQVFEDLSHPSSNVSCACLLSAENFEVLDLPYRDCWVYGNLSIVASCNGLICLQHEDDGNVYLWNPARKQFRGLLDEPKGNCPRGEFFSLGFGFDANTNDYKVVRYRKDLNSEVQVYNLNTDSWRSIDVAVPLLTEIISSLKAPYQNVIYCWLGSVDHITDSVMIISFDFSSEKFGTIPLPSNIKNSSDSLEISIIKGSIACIQRDSYCGTDSWHGEIWMLSGYGFEESWNKLYRFGPFPRGWYWLMAFLKEEFVLLLKEGQLCLYNLSTRDTEYLPVQVQVQGSEQLGPSFDVVLYKESLVSIKKGSGSACCN